MLEMLDDPYDDPAQSTYLIGDRVVGKYTLIRRLGVGGMGEVWAAQSDVLDTRVAIKLIRGGHRTPSGERRLLREARATAKLAEPSIVRVFDFGATEREEPFIVMEFLDGQDLASSLREQKRIPATEAVRLLLPIVRALTVAHAAGIVHRDVKPENVFLANTATGGVQPKLLDFGIAQLGWAEHLTNSGAAMGSAEYMSPEQARGDEVDASADTWALSVILYEAITGRAPFFARNYNAVIQNILTKEPPPWPDFGDGSTELWDIVEKGLRKNRDERFQSSRALGQELAAWLSDRGISDDLAGVSLSASWGARSTAKVRSQRLPRSMKRRLLDRLTWALEQGSTRRGLGYGAIAIAALSIASFALLGGTTAPSPAGSKVPVTAKVVAPKPELAAPPAVPTVNATGAAPPSAPAIVPSAEPERARRVEPPPASKRAVRHEAAAASSRAPDHAPAFRNPFD